MRDASIAVPARDRRRYRRLERAVRGQSRGRPHGRHRDEPARLALLGAGLEGDRLPDRQGRGQAGGRLHARRARERHHRVTPASFEPTIDYVVTKMPRFTFEKFPGAEPLLTTSMKSVGEAMAIGRTFAESVQKALRSMETGLTGFNEVEIAGSGATGDKDAIARRAGASRRPTACWSSPRPIAHGLTTAEIHAACKYDPWFLRADPRASSRPRSRSRARRACRGDRQRAAAAEAAWASPTRGWPSSTGTDEAEVAAAARRARRPPGLQAHRHLRRRVPLAHALYVFDLRGRRRRRRPNARPSPPTARRSIILGGGPNRIGQGIEFDYCCVHAAYALNEAGIETIMVNCNPETVSTDYDTSDRLYFEPLTAEDVIELVARRAAQRHAAGRHRAVRRPDAAEARARRSRRPASRSSAPRPTPSTSPRTASASSSCCSELEPQAAGQRHRARRRRGRARSPTRIGYPGRDPPVLCAGRPRHGDRPRPRRRSPRYMTQRGQGLGRQPGADRPLSAGRDRGRCRRARRRRRASTSPASWSISRRPASIRATAPARCRPIRCRPRSSPRSSARPRRWPRRSASSG